MNVFSAAREVGSKKIRSPLSRKIRDVSNVFGKLSANLTEIKTKGSKNLLKNNSDGNRRREEAKSLLDFAIDRDQIIILESELLETPNGRYEEHLRAIRKQAKDNADALRRLLAEL